jgi:hypothetical protein
MRKAKKSNRPNWCGIESLEPRLLLSTVIGTFTSTTPFTGTDPITGNGATFSMTGPGTGTISEATAGTTPWDLVMTGTTSASAVKVATAVAGVAGAVDLESVNVGTPTAELAMGSFSAPNVNFYSANGSEGLSVMNFTGGLTTLTLNNSMPTSTTTMRQINIGANDSLTAAVALTFNDADDVAINSLMPVSSITAASIECDVTGATSGLVSESYIRTVTIAGNVGVVGHGTTQIVDMGASGIGISTITVHGSLENATIGCSGTGGLGSVTIGGNVDNGSQVLGGISGDIGAVSVGGNIDNGSQILARDGDIASLTVKGSVQNTNVVGLTAVAIMGNGNIGPILVYGNVSGDVNQNLQSITPTGTEIGIGGAGNIASIYIKGNMQNGAQIGIMGSGGGTIGTLTVLGNLGNGSAITSQVQNSNGNIGAVNVTGNMDNGGVIALGGYLTTIVIRGTLGMMDGGKIISDRGITSLNIVTGSLGNGAAAASVVQVIDTGSIGLLTIGANINNAQIEASAGNIGFSNTAGTVGVIRIGGSVEDGSSITTTQGSIATLYIPKGSLGSAAGAPTIIKINGIGNIGPVTIGQNMDNAQLDTTTGNIGTISSTLNNGLVTIAGSMLDGSIISTGVEGSITRVTIGGNFGTSTGATPGGTISVGRGNIGVVTVKDDMDDASVSAAIGNIGTVAVTGAMQYGSTVKTTTVGSITSVTVGRNMTGSGSGGSTGVSTHDGNVGSVVIGDNLDNSAAISANGGNVTAVTIRGNMDHGAQITNSNGTTGIGSVYIGQNLQNSGGTAATTISSTGPGGVGSVTVVGSVVGTDANLSAVVIHGDVRVSSLNVEGGGAAFLNMTSGTASAQFANLPGGGPGTIGSLTVNGALTSSQIVETYGGTITSVRCKELASTVIATGVMPAVIAAPTGTPADFPTENSTLGTLTVTGLGGIFATGDTEVLAWTITTATFSAASVSPATVIFEYHTLSHVTLAPTGATVHQVN